MFLFFLFLTTEIKLVHKPQWSLQTADVLLCWGSSVFRSSRDLTVTQCLCAESSARHTSGEVLSSKLTLPVSAQRPPRPALSPAFFLTIKLSVEPPYGTVLTGGTHDDLCLAQHSHHSTLPYLVEAKVSRHQGGWAIVYFEGAVPWICIRTVTSPAFRVFVAKFGFLQARAPICLNPMAIWTLTWHKPHEINMAQNPRYKLDTKPMT